MNANGRQWKEGPAPADALASAELLRTYRKTLQWCEADPFHASLRLHPLNGRIAGLHSVSINRSYRVTLECLIEDERIVPANVGDHGAVYCAP